MDTIIYSSILIYLLFVLLTKRAIELTYSVRGKKYGKREYLRTTLFYSFTPIVNIIVFIYLWINNPYSKQYVNDRKCYKVILKMYKSYRNAWLQSSSEYELNKGYCFWLHCYGYGSDKHLNFIKKFTGFVPESMWWFPRGVLISRVNLLEKAIEHYNNHYRINL